MRLLELKQPNIIVVYGGGFQPFHEGHMSSYRQAKAAFPSASFFVAASNVTTERPFEFKEKQFLAQQAGVRDPFIQVGTMSYVNDNGRKVTSTPLNPLEALKHFNPERDVLVIIRSERDPMKTTDVSYYQPWRGVQGAEPFGKHAYIYVTKKHDFNIAGNPVYSGSQVRELYSGADDATKMQILQDLYPQSRQLKKIKQIFDKRLGGVSEEVTKNIIFADTGDAFVNGQEDAINFRPKNDAKYTLRHKYRSRYNDGYKHGESRRDRSINPATGQPYIAFGPASKGEYDPVIAGHQSAYIFPSYNTAKKEADKSGKKVVRGGVSKWKIVDKNDPDPEIFEEDLDEASLATMRDYFAGDEDARDPYKITQQRLYFSKDKKPDSNVKRKEFRSQWDYEQWLKKHKVTPITNQVKEDLDPEQEAEHLLEYLRKIHKRWAIVSKKEGRPLVYFKGDGKPSAEWVERQERRIRKHKKK